MTINEIPLLDKEGPGRYEWNSLQIMNLPICMCSQEEKEHKTMLRVSKMRVVESDPVCHWNMIWERLAR